MPARNFTDAEEEQIAKTYLAGHSARAIARAYGKSHHTSIIAALRRQGVKQRSPAERNRLYKLDPHVFDSIDSEHAAYWLGFLYADGCVHKRSLQIALREPDRGQLVKLKRFLKTEAPIKNADNTIRGVDKKYRRSILFVTDKHLVDRLRELGIKPKRPDHRPMLQQTPESLYSHLIRGYFDGDGSARKDASVAFCGSKCFLIWIRGVIAKNAGTNPDLAISKHKHADLYYLYVSGRIQALKATGYMYRGATVWMDRKRRVIDSWPEPKEQKRDERGRYI